MTLGHPSPQWRRNSPFFLTGGVVLLILAAIYFREGSLAGVIIGAADLIVGFGLIAIGAVGMRRRA